jgi:hypothetical protein
LLLQKKRKREQGIFRKEIRLINGELTHRDVVQLADQKYSSFEPCGLILPAHADVLCAQLNMVPIGVKSTGKERQLKYYIQKKITN